MKKISTAGAQQSGDLSQQKLSTVHRLGTAAHVFGDVKSRTKADYATSAGCSFSGSGSSMVIITSRQRMEEPARNIKTASQL
jgi:hypothetical protein